MVFTPKSILESGVKHGGGSVRLPQEEKFAGLKFQGSTIQYGRIESIRQLQFHSVVIRNSLFPSRSKVQVIS